jgi:hypothetical protein
MMVWEDGSIESWQALGVIPSTWAPTCGVPIAVDPPRKSATVQVTAALFSVTGWINLIQNS